MAGLHFIILKINGIDVSQMPHEDAVQMFLKASEPILVEVRRRSYNVNSDENVECVNQLLCSDRQINQKANQTPKCQSPIVSQLTSPTRQQSKATTIASADVANSINFHSLIISSSKNSIGLDSSNSNGISETYLKSTSNSFPPVLTTSHENSASSPTTTTEIQTNECAELARIANLSATARLSTIISPSRSKNQQYLPFKDPKLTSHDSETLALTFSNKCHVSIGVQTDSYATDFIFSGSTMLNSEEIIENDHNLFTECLAPEIDIEEITLRKSDSNERLGLTVCYSSGGGNGSGSDDTDTCTEVYISDIVPDSIAGRDGRLRQGDQILQVNGKDVSNKEETETLIAENNNAVTLLVSRYLYGEDDEFNETGDFYDDDEPNMAYANCFLGTNYIFAEELPKSGKSTVDNSPEKKATAPVEEVSVENNVRSEQNDFPSHNEANNTTAIVSTTSFRDPLNHQNIRAHLDQVNQEIAVLDSRVENMMSQHSIKPLKMVELHTSQQKEPTVLQSSTQVMDYDTEHIYETIPEDSESEPFYCSPYEGSEHHTRVEQWLGMQDTAEVNESRLHSAHFKPVITQQSNVSLSISTKIKNGTVQSANSSAGDDHENSSSAYNTGGSCNSNTMTPLTLELNANSREHYNTSTLVLCTSKQLPTNSVIQPNHGRLLLSSEITDSQKSSSSHRYMKEKSISPTHSWKVSHSLSNKHKLLTDPQKNETLKSNLQSTPISAASTMYTNVANLQQTMLLQQQLFRQALIHQRVPSSSVPCPQFTAPNLSQYHFVSSQEVSTVKLNSHPNEEHMVWKVKRRQDGTRYIVRRPARSRFLRNRALRISAERNDQTTEDDTISEIKTGRYWTKEERKKHIERARERRQRQQIIITNKNNELIPTNNSAAIQSSPQIRAIEITGQKSNFSDKLINDVPQSKLSNTILTPKSYRQNSTPSIGGQSGFPKKLAKKQAPTAINSPGEVNSLPIVLNPSQTIGSGCGGNGVGLGGSTLKTTTTSSANKMFQSVVDNSRVIQPRL